MKSIIFRTAAVLLILGMLSGCGKPQEELPVPTQTPEVPTETVSTEPTAPAEREEVEEPAAPETEEVPEEKSVNLPDSVDAVYAQQIGRYYTAICEQWDESAYFDHEMSPMAAYYYEGSALDNIGFACMDLNGDEIPELLIGAIENAEQHPLVFEIWTLRNGEPVMLAQSGSHNRYYLQYAEDDGLWSVAYEAENGAANFAVYYLMLQEGNFEVMQGIVFDALANESEPWFMAYDLDWDTSNDTPLDEETANAVMDTNRNIYTAVEYLPYSLCK